MNGWQSDDLRTIRCRLWPGLLAAVWATSLVESCVGQANVPVPAAVTANPVYGRSSVSVPGRTQGSIPRELVLPEQPARITVHEPATPVPLMPVPKTPVPPPPTPIETASTKSTPKPPTAEPNQTDDEPPTAEVVHAVAWPEAPRIAMTAGYEDATELIPLPQPPRMARADTETAPLPTPAVEGTTVPSIPMPPTPAEFPSTDVPPGEFPPGGELLPEPVIEGRPAWGDAFCPDCQQGSPLIDPATLDENTYSLRTAQDHFGIGSQQVPFAIFHMDTAEPLSQLRVRADFAYGLKTPDRAERFWATSPLGPPQTERSVDMQTYSVYSEVGGAQFSTFTEIPLLAIDPEVNGNTMGLGTINVGQKFLLTNAKNQRWQVAQILRTYLNTGSSTKGLGNGLTALEPGVLFRYRCDDLTYLHGELKYWIPLGGDPNFAGEVLRYGVGVSTVNWQSDDVAVMSTLELLGFNLGDGLATQPDGSTRRNDGENFFQLLPGLRVALGPSGDLGLMEIGASGGFTFGDDGWNESQFLLDLRWSY